MSGTGTRNSEARTREGNAASGFSVTGGYIECKLVEIAGTLVFFVALPLPLQLSCVETG